MNDDIKSIIKHVCKSNKILDLSNEINFRFAPHIENVFAQCYLQKKLIEISQSYWDKSTFNDKNNAIAHETSHIIINQLFGSDVSHHGNEWKSCMRNAGYQPIIFMNQSKGDLYELSCGCKSVWLPKEKAKQILADTSYCTECNHLIYLSDA